MVGGDVSSDFFYLILFNPFHAFLFQLCYNTIPYLKENVNVRKLLSENMLLMLNQNHFEYLEFIPICNVKSGVSTVGENKWIRIIELERTTRITQFNPLQCVANQLNYPWEMAVQLPKNSKNGDPTTFIRSHILLSHNVVCVLVCGFALI